MIRFLVGFLIALLASLFVMELVKAGERSMCHMERPPDDPEWHYRTKIPPRPELRCWYLGERMKPRGELYWAEAPTVPPIDIMRDEDGERLFDQRWIDPSGWTHKE